MPGRGEVPRHTAGIYQQRATGAFGLGAQEGRTVGPPLFFMGSPESHARARFFSYNSRAVQIAYALWRYLSVSMQAQSFTSRMHMPSLGSHIHIHTRSWRLLGIDGLLGTAGRQKTQAPADVPGE